jgi:two-component SAPR family response regulator
VHDQSRASIGRTFDPKGQPGLTRTNLLDGLNILIVEDEFLIAMQLTRMIQELGAQVLGPVSTVNAGTELLQNSAVDAAVVDINLGTESSAPLAEELLARGIPVVLTTGYSEDMLPDSLAGVPRISKPYTKTGLERIATAHFVRS